VKITALERFMRKVDTGGPDGCWLWTAYRNPCGYGMFYMDRALRSSHRVIYGLVVAEVPPGMCVLHRCDNPACVRPGHLFLGTQTENVADREAKGRGRHRASAGEANGSAKLTWGAVGEIRRRYAAGGVSQQLLAREYGVSRSQISGIVAGVFWVC
jgi:hypothetical protein